ncbi:MAG: hypothetical protein PUA83_09575 [Clostridiales bacterium]|nr:hypothetical protein [Clostridiales bacterium]
MTDGTNTLHIGYDGFGAESLTYNGTLYYYVKNAQGDVIGLVNGSGAVAAEYAYDAWENILSISGSGAGTVGAANPIRCSGSARPAGATMGGPDKCRFRFDLDESG